MHFALKGTPYDVLPTASFVAAAVRRAIQRVCFQSCGPIVNRLAINTLLKSRAAAVNLMMAFLHLHGFTRRVRLVILDGALILGGGHRRKDIQESDEGP